MKTLTAKEREIHEKGLVSVLRQLHDDLDAAVFAAYGWPATLTDEEILERLVALNRERATGGGAGAGALAAAGIPESAGRPVKCRKKWRPEGRSRPMHRLPRQNNPGRNPSRSRYRPSAPPSPANRPR